MGFYHKRDLSLRRIDNHNYHSHYMYLCLIHLEGQKYNMYIRHFQLRKDKDTLQYIHYLPKHC